MGLRNMLRDVLGITAATHAAGSPIPLESAWATPNHLLSIPTPPTTDRPVTRQLAMSVPAVARARRIIVGSIARCPLEARVGGKRADQQPLWLSRTDGVQSPHFRMTWTIDDLLFYGWSLWAVERDHTGRVIRADRVPYHLWDISPTGDVTVGDTPADPSSICLIPGLDEGLLHTSAAAIRHAADLADRARQAATLPAAQIELHQTQGDPMTHEQIRDLVESWVKARRGANGGVAYSSPSIEVKELGKTDPSLLIEGRNLAAVDIARAAGVPATLIDAHTSGTGNITYANEDARNIRLIDYGLAPFMACVAARLGLDDMVPRGWNVAFDLTDLTSPTIGDLDVPDDTDQTTTLKDNTL